MAILNEGRPCMEMIEVDGETVCCDLPATQQRAGEMDSFGTEWWYLCDSDAKQWDRDVREHSDSMRSGNCEWCKKKVEDRVEFRGFESDGPWDKQWVCKACRKKDRDNAEEELAFLDSQDNFYNRRY